MSEPAQRLVYLNAYLGPLTEMLERPDVTDIYVNKAQEVWVETLGGVIERHDAPALTEATLARLARQTAAITHQGVNREHPLLSATLPDGARVQFIVPPATRAGIVLAIRKHVSADMSLADYAATGAFHDTAYGKKHGGSADDQDLDKSLADGDIVGALGQAVRERRNILVSGGTSTGKTTFLNALIAQIPQDERLILIEDTPELKISHSNAVSLLATRGALGEARVSTNDLLSASLRMRPDRIIVGELRGPEAFTFLRAVNTGHPGSMTTVHADSAVRAIEQIVLLILQSGVALSRADIRHYVQSTVDIYVQLSRRGGQRKVEQVVLGRDLID